MSNHRLTFIVAFSVVSAACATDPVDTPAPDAALPIDPAGRYAVHSSFVLSAPPPHADSVLDGLAAAIDGPDDPSRYLVDLIIERLPEGRTRTIAAALAPYVAAYLNERIDEIAPDFLAGARALSAGLSRIAHRFGTLETIEIAASGVTRRTITGVRFDAIDVRFDPIGLPDVTATTDASFAEGRLTIEPHAMTLPYARIVRLGLERAVVPGVVPGAASLPEALVALVDCPRLGALVAGYVGIGSPALYETACSAALLRLASAIDARIDALDTDTYSLEVVGAALGRDLDGDHALDVIEGGAWIGTLAGVRVARGLFDGGRR